MRTDVAATLTIWSPALATALLQVVVADAVTEQLTVLSGGAVVDAEEFDAEDARVHRLELNAGDTTITYSASTQGGGAPRKVTPAEWAVAVRLSSSRRSPTGCTGG